MKKEINLYELTKDCEYNEESILLIKGKIKSEILDIKLDYGSKTEISFVYRKSKNIILDIFVNSTADSLLQLFEI